MMQQKSSRGNGSNLEMAEIRHSNKSNFITFLAESYLRFAILLDIWRGILAIRELPGFIAWMMKKGGAA
jgi:hypothetical protein